MVWDITTPSGTDNLSNGDNIIREFKTDVQTALKANDATLGDEGVFPVSTSAPRYRYRGLKGTTAQRPAFGNYGLYFNTSTNTLQRDSGSAWEDVATQFAAGTKIAFYQAAAPTGWTRDAVVNDRFIRIVSAGSPGTTGGSFAALTTSSNGSHSHTVNSHTHDDGSLFASIGSDNLNASGQLDLNIVAASFTADRQISSLNDDGGESDGQATGVDVGGITGSTSPGTDSQGAHTHSLTHGSAQHQYADFLLATKD